MTQHPWEAGRREQVTDHHSPFFGAKRGSRHPCCLQERG